MRANGLVWGLRVADRRVEFVSYISAFYFVALVVDNNPCCPEVGYLTCIFILKGDGPLFVAIDTGIGEETHR